MVSLKYYTYAYLREDKTPYYIGKGKDNRAFKKHGKIPIPKDRNRIIFLKQNLTEVEAFKHEKYMIAIFGRKDLGTGILLNRTNGGEGPSGFIVTKKQRETRRETGKVNHKRGVGIHGRSKKQMTEDGKKGGKAAYEKGVGIYSRSKEQMIEDSKKGGKIGGSKGGKLSYERRVGLFNRSKEQMIEDSKKGGKISSSQRWKCNVTGYVSTSAGLSHYQISKGIDVSNRVKFYGTIYWKIIFVNGLEIIVTVSLSEWAKENGYSKQTLDQVRTGRVKNHRGIVKIEQQYIKE